MTNKKALFMKWIQNLFYLQCAAFAGSLIGELPFIGSWFAWVTRIIFFGTIFVIYKLSPLNIRYRKAAIFMGISVIVSIFTKELLILALVGIICSIIAMYQEYMGHSEVMSDKDNKLSQNWRSLFQWELWGNHIVAFIAAICAMVMGVATQEVGIAEGIVEAIMEGYSIILSIVYLVLLKRTRDTYEKYEPAVEEVVVDEN